MTSEPMSDEILAKIDRAIALAKGSWDIAFEDIVALLAEVKRLRALDTERRSDLYDESMV